MLKIALTILISICITQLYAQTANDSSNIKLFVYRYGIMTENPGLDSSQRERLFRKTQQLISQTGVAELGYSTFLISPKFDVVSVDVDESGIAKVYMAECELNISIERINYNNQGGAVFNSMTKNITGSGLSKAEAINNAVSSISSSSPEIIAFLSISKQKIYDYFKQHCHDVLKQADQALSLKNYAEAIALYFSVPTTAPCYKDAVDASKGVYTKYEDDQCEVKLTKLKAYVAMAQDNANYYDKAMAIMDELNPTAKCYKEAVMQIDKIEKRFDDAQKQAWDFKKKQAQDDTEVKKEIYKAMGRISSNYQPSPSIVIAH